MFCRHLNKASVIKRVSEKSKIASLTELCNYQPPMQISKRQLVTKVSICNAIHANKRYQNQVFTSSPRNTCHFVFWQFEAFVFYSVFKKWGLKLLTHKISLVSRAICSYKSKLITRIVSAETILFWIWIQRSQYLRSKVTVHKWAETLWGNTVFMAQVQWVL